MAYKQSIARAKQSIILQRIFNLHARKRKDISLIESMYQKNGIDKLYYYYEDNLRIVLRIFSQLIEELNGRTVITTDHGEAFGEQGIWEHPIETNIPVLKEVPWLEVKS